MRILYFYQYFCTPKGSWGTRVYEFAKRWVGEGHQVTVVTSVYYKSDLKKGKGWVSRFNVDGIDVIQLNIDINNKQGILKRAFTFIQYALMSSYFALRERADVVVASSGPITAGVPGLVARYFRRKKLVFEVRDLWPEGAIEMGLLKNPLLKKIAYRLEKQCYRAATHIITLSPGMAMWIQKHYGFTHITSVPNASDLELFGTKQAIGSLPSWAEGKKLALYTGNIGAVNNSELLLGAAQALEKRGRTDIAVVLIGDGQQKAKLTPFTKSLSTFNMLGIMPKTDLVAWVQKALVMLVPLKGTPVLDTSSPNKLFEALAASTPVIQTTQGWIKDLLVRTNSGITVPANDPEELANQLEWLADNSDKVLAMRLAARKTAETEFNRATLSGQMLSVLKQVHSA